jgi:RimJ/RimL family protein N-acetyltransferase
VTGREATPADLTLLNEFKCAPPSGESWARDVQRWSRALLQWRDDGAAGRHVRLYEDETGLVGLAAWRHLVDGEPGTGFLVYLVAVRVDRRREKLGQSIVRGLIEHLSQSEPGMPVAWLVDPRNVASVARSARFADDEPSSHPGEPHFLEYTGTLPTVGPTTHNPESD